MQKSSLVGSLDNHGSHDNQADYTHRASQWLVFTLHVQATGTLPQAIMMLNTSISYHLISEGMLVTDAVCD